ncbi:MAG: hypothetical protein DMF72_02615 [Acidobacteria bacterium]|nr:MAG: hypothetical protein DMF72_02615 [Acidobacteriota bacterium]
MRDAERETPFTVSQMQRTPAPLALLESANDEIVEDENADRDERKNVNRARRVKFKHTQQVEDHQYCEHGPRYVHL